MIVRVMADLLQEKWGRTFEAAPDVWILHELNLPPKDAALWVSSCPGGAFSFFANYNIGDEKIILRVRTVRSVFRRTNEVESFHFEYCDPAFPENFYDLVGRSAVNVLKCCKLEHDRSWRRHSRSERLSRVSR